MLKGLHGCCLVCVLLKRWRGTRRTGHQEGACLSQRVEGRAEGRRSVLRLFRSKSAMSLIQWKEGTNQHPVRHVHWLLGTIHSSTDSSAQLAYDVNQRQPEHHETRMHTMTSTLPAQASPPPSPSSSTAKTPTSSYPTVSPSSRHRRAADCLRPNICVLAVRPMRGRGANYSFFSSHGRRMR